MARIREPAPDRDFPRSQVRRTLAPVHVRFNLKSLYQALYIQPPRSLSLLLFLRSQRRNQIQSFACSVDTIRLAHSILSIYTLHFRYT
jgi:hypothetical protein